MQALRELIPYVGTVDRIMLAYDIESQQDFHLIERILSELGARVLSISMARVPTGGVVGTTRAGGWRDCTATKILERYRQNHDLPSLRLGLRLYFVRHLGRLAKEAFDYDVLGGCLHKAEGMLARMEGVGPDKDPSALDEFVGGLVRPQDSFVDPHRLIQ